MTSLWMSSPERSDAGPWAVKETASTTTHASPESLTSRVRLTQRFKKPVALRDRVHRGVQQPGMLPDSSTIRAP